MLADLFLITGKTIIFIVSVIFIYHNLTSRTKFLKKHGRSYLESEKPDE